MKRVGAEFIVVVAASALARSAIAGDCANGDCPAGWDTTASPPVYCDGEDGKSADLCDRPTGDVIECNMDPGDAAKGVQVFAVFDYADNGGADYSIWGYDADGDPFACYFDDTDTQVAYVDIFGTEENDVIVLNDGTATSTVEPVSNLESPDKSQATVATVYAGDGADTVHGSYCQNTSGFDCYQKSYSEYLYGEGGSDTMNGHYGPDYLAGGAGNDFLNGGLGADTVEGEGDDDLVCGGLSYSGADVLHGGTGNDIIWEPYATGAITPTVDAGKHTGDSDSCGSSKYGASWVNCESTTSTAPSPSCPSAP